MEKDVSLTAEVNSDEYSVKSAELAALKAAEDLRLKYDRVFMAVAELSAMRSKDPVTQVGACIVDNEQQIVGIGYNGMPVGLSDDEFSWLKNDADPLEDKRTYVCHAEMNAVLNGNGKSTRNCRVYVALFPCCECAKLLIQSGIREVIYAREKDATTRPTYRASRRMMESAGIILRRFNPSEYAPIKIDFALLLNENESPADWASGMRRVVEQWSAFSRQLGGMNC